MKKVVVVIVTTFIFAILVNGQTPCPKISVTGPPGLTKPNEPWVFTASLGNEFENIKVEYIWTVSGGKIVDGQGTNIIKILQNYGEETVTATLEIKGLPKNCANTVSASGEMIIDVPACGGLPYLQDEIGKTDWESEKARLLNAAYELPNFKDFGIVIRISAPKKDKTFFKNRSAKFTKFLTEVSKIPKNKFKIEFAGTDDYRIQYYLIPLSNFDVFQNERKSIPTSPPQSQSKPQTEN